MDINFKGILRSLFVVAAIVSASNASASLAPFQSFVGKYALSTDGFGSTSESGVISASVPAGSTVVAAYLYSATNNTDSVPAVSLDGNLVSFGPAVSNTTACCNLKSYRADVTSLVAAAINGGGGGIYDFDVLEGGASWSDIDGEALVVVYSNPALPEATVGLLDGFASVTGDTTNINFATPLNPADPGFFAEMSLGISFSCCDSQRSTIKVNDQLLTENAGNYDDGVDLSNGSLITVGGFDDALSSGGDSYANDGERYNLASFVVAGDTSIKVDTFNASEDDNIFFAGFYVSGKAGINEEPPTDVPEPGSLILFMLGVAALLLGRKRVLFS
jgi:hypothetical protein